MLQDLENRFWFTQDLDLGHGPSPNQNLNERLDQDQGSAPDMVPIQPQTTESKNTVFLIILRSLSL